MISFMNEFEIERKSSASPDLAFFGIEPPAEEVRVSEGAAREPLNDGSEETRVSLELDLAGPEGETEARVSKGLTDVSSGDFVAENGEKGRSMPPVSEESRVAPEPSFGEVGMKTEGPGVSRDVGEGTRIPSEPVHEEVEANMEEDSASETKAGETRGTTMEEAGDSEDKAGKEGSAVRNAGSEQLATETMFSDGGTKSPTEAREDHEQIISVLDTPKTNSWMHGFESGDMVWGKVKSHPWWPGRIFSEAFASPSVRRTKREGHVLVAFFGDSSYGWFDPAELVPFDQHFAEKSRQTNSRTFVKAVEEAVDEANRRQGLGLSCYCRNQFNFRPMFVSGFFAVDVIGYEPGTVYSRKQIEKARDSFVPVEALSFVNRLALMPQNIDCWNIDWIKHKATLLALRKAMFEEFDETYAEAFGMQPVRPSRDAQGVLDQLDKVPPRAAPLSGPLVIAEALTERKSSTKTSTKSAKDPSKKNKYLFKRREASPSIGPEPIEGTLPKPSPSTGPKPIEGTLSKPSPSTGPKPSPTTDPKAAHSTGALPSPSTAVKSTTPDTHHVTQGQGNIPHYNFAQGPQRNINYFPQPQVPNVHHISQGQFIPSLPVFKEAEAASSLYAQFDEYVLQKRAPANAEQQQPFSAKQEDGKSSSSQAHPSSKTSPVGVPGSASPFDFPASHSPAPDVGVWEPFQGSDGGKLKTQPSVDEDPDGKSFQKAGRSALDSKEGAGIKFPHVFDSIEPKPWFPTPAGDLAKVGDGSRSFSGTSTTNVPSPMNVELPHMNSSEMVSVGVVKKVKIRKQIQEHLSPNGEKKTRKKKKRESGLDAGMDQPPQKHPKIAKDGQSLKRLAGKFIGIGPTQAESPAAELQGKDDRGYDSWRPSHTPAVELPKLDLGSLNLELPQLVSDLSALALDPFYGVDHNCPVIVRHAFLRFRSLVYQKSLVLPPASEPDMSELCVAKSAVAGSVQEPGRGNAEIALEGTAGEQREPTSSTKPLKHPLKPTLKKDDPTKGGRKRIPSDRLEEMSAKRLKKLSQLKSLASEKKAGFPQKTTDGQHRGEQKETATTTATPFKPIKVESAKKPELPPPPKVASPTYLVMKFPPRTTLPSIASLKARFARFGPLDLNGTRVYWKTFTCKVLFKYKSDSQAAYNHVQSNDIFGQVRVNYSLKELDVPAPEPPEPGKQARSDDGPQLRPSNGSGSLSDSRPSILRHQRQHSVQLKSCLKKPSGDETSPAGGSAVKESPRVKFLLGGEDSRGPEPSVVVTSSSSSISGLDGTSSSLAPLDDVKSPKLVNFMLPPPPAPFPLISDVPPPLPPRLSDLNESFSKALPYRVNYGEVAGRNGSTVDISLQMLNLLLRCSDIVTNVTSTFGYAPYHPL